MCGWRMKNRNREAFSKRRANFGSLQIEGKESGKRHGWLDGRRPISDGEEAEGLLRWKQRQGSGPRGDRKFGRGVKERVALSKDL